MSASRASGVTRRALLKLGGLGAAGMAWPGGVLAQARSKSVEPAARLACCTVH